MVSWKSCATALAVGFLAFADTSGAVAQELAKTAFGSKKLPAAAKPESFGFYSKGCFSGGMAIATDGPNWQAMRLSRNRRWGHPDMIRLIEQLSRDAAKDGWPGLMVGDISQPRGGPMLSGHASHQIGLDADIWLTPMPNRRLSAKERENLSATSMLKGNSLYVNDAVWTPAHFALIKRATSYSRVERVLVHPGIKKKLCDSETGDRSWLSKVRPYWGHYYHFHIRLSCPADSPGCRGQEKPPRDDGCGKDLAWWFTDEPWKPAPKSDKPAKPPARDTMRISDLPAACRMVLSAPSPESELAVTLTGPGGARVSSAPLPATANAFAAPSDVPLPTPRPDR